MHPGGWAAAVGVVRFSLPLLKIVAGALHTGTGPIAHIPRLTRQGGIILAPGGRGAGEIHDRGLVDFKASGFNYRASVLNQIGIRSGSDPLQVKLKRAGYPRLDQDFPVGPGRDNPNRKVRPSAVKGNGEIDRLGVGQPYPVHLEIYLLLHGRIDPQPLPEGAAGPGGAASESVAGGKVNFK